MKRRSASTGRLERPGSLELNIEKLGFKQNIAAFHLIRQEIAPEEKKFTFISIDDAPTSKKYMKIFKSKYLPPLEHKDGLEGIDRILYERHHPEYLNKANGYKHKHGAYVPRESRIPLLARTILDVRRSSQEHQEQIGKPENRRQALKLGSLRAISSFGKFLNNSQVLLKKLE
jgi:hypothetical protein